MTSHPPISKVDGTLNGTLVENGLIQGGINGLWSSYLRREKNTDSNSRYFVVILDTYYENGLEIRCGAVRAV